MGDAKIISLLELRKRSKISPEHLSYNGTAFIKDRFILAASIIDELVSVGKEIIVNVGMKSQLFRLSQKSIDSCLETNLKEFFDGGEEALSLIYEAVIEGMKYAVVVSASVTDNNVEFEGEFVKWSGTTWLAYVNGDWMEGPGPDFI